MKKVLMATIILIGSVGSATADATKVINNLESIPAKVHNHIQMEVEKTKEYQKKSWAEAKEQWLRLKAKFIKQ
jgi:hypothetical protein|tara:strand:- start:172 stop:390 length:219 start_codon:yes stop_codon:yes gene_type:complete